MRVHMWCSMQESPRFGMQHRTEGIAWFSQPSLNWSFLYRFLLSYSIYRCVEYHEQKLSSSILQEQIQLNRRNQHELSLHRSKARCRCPVACGRGIPPLRGESNSPSTQAAQIPEILPVTHHDIRARNSTDNASLLYLPPFPTAQPENENIALRLYRCRSA